MKALEKAADLLYGSLIYLVGLINKQHNLCVDLARGRASFSERVAYCYGPTSDLSDLVPISPI